MSKRRTTTTAAIRDSPPPSSDGRITKKNKGGGGPPTPLVGGPGTKLPFAVESLLSWILAISCLSVSGYHYIRTNLLPHVWEKVVMVKHQLKSILGDQAHTGGLKLGESSSLGAGKKDDDRTFVVSRKGDDGEAGGGTALKQEDHPLLEELKQYPFWNNPYLPLTMWSKRELTDRSPKERHDQLQLLLRKRTVHYKSGGETPHTRREEGEEGTMTMNRTEEIKGAFNLDEVSDDVLVHIFRTDIICRRLASLAMRPFHVKVSTAEYVPEESSGSDVIDDPSEVKMTSLLREYPELELPRRLAKVWADLLTLPSPGRYESYDVSSSSSTTEEADQQVDPSPLTSSAAEVVPGGRRHRECLSSSNDDDDEDANDPTFPYLISLVVPAYREDGHILGEKLSKALESSVLSSSTEVIIIDAGGCSNLDRALESMPSLEGDPTTVKHRVDYSSSVTSSAGRVGKGKVWARTDVRKFTGGGGRGPCLNYGADAATGQILAFLHSDTSLPPRWDEKIVHTLLGCDTNPSHRSSSEGLGHHRTVKKKMSNNSRPNSCAFSFGIDTSPEGLNGGPYPPGIKAVETTANIRTHVYSLPYGDQVISIPSTTFRFLGGFPDQCLMEDYEIVSLLRRRSTWVHRFFPTPATKSTYSHSQSHREHLEIIGSPAALCSPRRWQRFGVLFVTFVNSKLVNLYAGGLTPDDLFRRYYSAEPPAREHEMSPWEVELEEILVGNKS